MTKKLTRIHALFLITGFIFLITCFLFGDNTLDINVHDTYFVIHYQHVGILVFLIQGVYSLLYFFMRRHLNYMIGLLHLFFQIPLLLILILTAFFYFGGAPRRYFTTSEPEFFNFSFLNDPALLVVFLFLMAQLLFIINIIVSIISVTKQKKK